MRQTYFYSGGPAGEEPRERPAPPEGAVETAPPAPVSPDAPPPLAEARTGRREKKKKGGSERGAALLIGALCLLLGGTAILMAMRSEPLELEDFHPDWGGNTPVLAVASPQVELQRAENGDGTTLSVVPKPEEAPKSLQTIYQEVNPAIVSIQAAMVRGLVQGVAQGTGVIMTENGYIITNAHVIDSSFRVDVSLENGVTYEAKLVGMDRVTDLAVLKIEATGLAAAIFGDSEDMMVGDTVVAIGNPMGEELRGTMTDGILSAINRDMDVDGNTMTLLQTTAALNTGNSGGALVNDQGQVIGITNMKLVSTNAYTNTLEGLGFAIPTATVKPVVDALIAYGHVVGRPVLGVTVKPLTTAEREQRSLDHGLWVEEVAQQSDAAEKLRKGDILLSANGVDLDRNEDLLEVRDGLGVGDALTFQVDRNGERFQVSVELVEQYQISG